jgi:periplasmic protein CpxP/Spy
MNEKKIKYLTIAVFALIAVNISLIAFLMLPKPPRDHGRDGRMHNKGAEFLMNRLELTDDQKAIFEQDFKAHKSRKDSTDKIIWDKKRMIFKCAITGDSIRAQAIIQEMNDIHSANEMEMYNHFQKMKQICTPEQLDRLNKVIERK